jgi:hypothetical protein
MSTVKEIYDQAITLRIQMVQEGTAKGRPADKVFADIKAKYS